MSECKCVCVCVCVCVEREREREREEREREHRGIIKCLRESLTIFVKEVSKWSTWSSSSKDANTWPAISSTPDRFARSVTKKNEKKERNENTQKRPHKRDHTQKWPHKREHKRDHTKGTTHKAHTKGLADTHFRVLWAIRNEDKAVPLSLVVNQESRKQMVIRCWDLRYPPTFGSSQIYRKSSTQEKMLHSTTIDTCLQH